MGENDRIFGPAGATAFSRGPPEVEVRLLDSGHFALEDRLDVIAGHVHDFLGKVGDRTVPAR